eukprot:CAMPEP_0167781882 /NCGR_PEP_ID=MMETSP0111_2-20121227/6195_1 /TAXON_ID=91324 /ORGANISM="Lotharella globosa, Strain CCCM811" /LENGTH=152 /DNA_ID=CAMNT_0007672625 /DNA_START=67 /DNA_END=525 /DNA_ORIENTATION=+
MSVHCQLVMKRSVEPTNSEILAKLVQGGKTKQTRIYALMALSHAGLHKSMHKHNVQIGGVLLSVCERKENACSLDELSAAIEGLIDLYSEDDVFVAEVKQLQLVGRLTRVTALYEARLRGKEGTSMDGDEREHHFGMLANLKAFVEYKAEHS